MAAEIHLCFPIGATLAIIPFIADEKKDELINLFLDTISNNQVFEDENWSASINYLLPESNQNEHQIETIVALYQAIQTQEGLKDALNNFELNTSLTHPFLFNAPPPCRLELTKLLQNKPGFNSYLLNGKIQRALQEVANPLREDVKDHVGLQKIAYAFCISFVESGNPENKYSTVEQRSVYSESDHPLSKPMS